MQTIKNAIRRLLAPWKVKEDGVAAPTTKPHWLDPMDTVARSSGWEASEVVPLKNINEFPVYDRFDRVLVGDSANVPASVKASVMDDMNVGNAVPTGGDAIAPMLQGWYSSQSFIGHQACAIISQHWLVDKACSMSGEDAVRNGWIIKAKGSDEALSSETHDELTGYDMRFKLKEQLAEFNRFKNIFGIRVVIFQVKSDDPLYYEKPFNADGITEGSYTGISQVDPYWMMPMMTSESTNDPSNPHFYEPEFWVISGKKYHRTHLIISRGPQPPDILKPTYIFGGIPLTQRIYERVYAAERTANEAPLLAMNKRTTAIHVDMDKVVLNEKSFMDKLAVWLRFRDNHAVKVLGKDEAMEQFDTSLADFDSVIMNQYQLVAAISKTPATKILGTSPKGFNATGEFEAKSYHEELESIQENVMHPFLERHYLILSRSLGMKETLIIVWEPVDSVSTKEQAELNDKKADTDTKNVALGAVSPDEVRSRLRDDKNSGYNRLTDDDANATPGESPENIAAFEKAGAASTGAEGQAQRGQASIITANEKTDAPMPTDEAPNDEANPATAVSVPTTSTAARTDLVSEGLRTLADALMAIIENKVVEGQDLPQHSASSITRTTTPGIAGSTAPSIAGAGNLIPTMDKYKLPKMKVGGMVIAVENPRGSIRAGQGIDGPWQSKMNNHYGFIRGTNGADGEEMDCFIGPNLKAQTVHIINQNDTESGEFDEHKIMIGFDSPEAAKEAYLSAYSKDWGGFDSMHSIDMASLKTWLKMGDMENAFSMDS